MYLPTEPKKVTKQGLTIWKGDTDNLKTAKFQYSLSVIEKKTQQKIGKNKDLKSIINQFDLTNQYKIYNPMADEYFFQDHLGS